MRLPTALLFELFVGGAQRIFHLPPLGHINEGGDNAVDLVVHRAVGADAGEEPTATSRFKIGVVAIVVTKAI